MDETLEPVRPRLRPKQETPTIAAAQEPEVSVEARQEEDKSYKVVISVIETYQDKGQAMDAYARFAGGPGQNRVVVKQGGKVLEEKDWVSVTDTRGHHSVNGNESRIIFLDEHLT